MAYSGVNGVFVYPMRKQTEARETLLTLVEDVGVPAELLTNDAPLLTGPQSEFVRNALHLRIKLGSVELHTQKKNKVEKTIGILKRRWKNRMSLTGMSKRLWPFVLTYEARIISMCARGRDGILRTVVLQRFQMLLSLS